VNQHEVGQIAELIHLTFPAVNDWFEQLTSTQQQAIRARRNATLMDLSMADAKAAVMSLAVDVDCPWAGYGQLEYAYAHVAKRAREIAGAKRMASESDENVRRGRRTGGTHDGGSLIEAKGLVAEFVEAKRRGELPDAKAVREWFDNREPMTQAEADQRKNRYVHLGCFDSGRIPVVAQLGRGRDGSIWWTTTSTGCECEAGREFRERGEDARLPTYDESRHVRIVPHATAADVLAEMARVREREFEAKRVPGFDQHNRAAQYAES